MAQNNRRYLCGTPKAECTGTVAQVSSCGEPQEACKVHMSPEEAFRCYSRYLVKHGYIQTGPRDFKDPKDGMNLVLTKKSHFGAMVRPGKTDDNGKSVKGRFVQEKPGGTVISH